MKEGQLCPICWLLLSINASNIRFIFVKFGQMTFLCGLSCVYIQEVCKAILQKASLAAFNLWCVFFPVSHLTGGTFLGVGTPAQCSLEVVIILNMHCNFLPTAELTSTV